MKYYTVSSAQWSNVSTLFNFFFNSALGFDHMQSSHDRDDYVRILWDNISSEGSGQFDKRGSQSTSHFGQKYDFDSIMHYASNAFSKSGKTTIQAIVCIFKN